MVRCTNCEHILATISNECIHLTKETAKNTAKDMINNIEVLQDHTEINVKCPKCNTMNHIKI